MNGPPRIRCLRDDRPQAALDAAFRIRAAGEVPLIGDPRWGAAHWDALRERLDGAATPPDACWATFTSGTTGAPRVVLRSAVSWERSFAAVTELVGLTADDVVALPVTVVSSMTVFQAAHARAVGAAVVLPRHGSLDDADLARATVMHATPLLTRDVVARLRSIGTHRLRVAVVGGDAIDDALRDEAAELGVRLVAYAGAAELSFVAVDRGAGLVPFPGVEVRIDDDDALWVRSPFVALGYALDAHGPLHVDADGWATVGDRARWIDGPDAPAARRRLRLLGRDDDAILTAGATVVPHDLEAELRRLPGVADALVVGLPARRVGHVVGALVVPDRAVSSESAFVADLEGRIRRDLPRPMHPRRWAIVPSLPRTAGGKADRAAAAARLRDDAAPVVPGNAA